MNSILSLILVGFLWGATDPFLKRASEGINNIETGSKLKNVLMELKYVGARLKYWLPFLLNQSGSVLYFWTLQSSPLAIAVPLSNSFKFVFTALTGKLLGEQLPGKSVIVGTVLITLGSALMTYDQVGS